MNQTRKKPTAILLCSLLAALAGACVTVNVNFPEAAVQKATDDYVRELYRAKERGRGSAKESPAPGADGEPSPAAKATARPTSLLSFPELLIPTAQAAEALDIRVNSAKALAIREKLAAQLDEVLAQKRAGSLGETSDGLLSVRGGDKLKPLLQKKVQRVADDENSLRKSLYEEVLSSNGIAKSRMKEIEKSFARSFQAESPSGTWVQDGEGRWSQKP